MKKRKVKDFTELTAQTKSKVISSTKRKFVSAFESFLKDSVNRRVFPKSQETAVESMLWRGMPNL